MVYPKGMINYHTLLNVVMFNQGDLVNINAINHSELHVRNCGNFANKGYHLNTHEGFNWQIVKDNIGELVLVPTKRND